MTDDDWGDDLTADVLADRYGLTVEAVEQVPMGTDTINRRVLTTDGQRLFVKEYASTADVNAARSAWDMSEFCRAADLPVPRVWPDRDGDLVALAEGSAWAVVDEAPGRVATGAMTVARAEHIGMVLGKMHRVLAGYPMPERVQQTRWHTEPVASAVARCGTALSLARRQGHGDLPQVRTQLALRRQDLLAHVGRLRAGLPQELVTQALHADFARPNMLVLTDVVTGIIDFRSAQAFPAWELGCAALDPRTVATSDQWPACATAMVSAYRSENPTLPLDEVIACGRIALLYMLFSFYGATAAEYELPHAAEADLKQHWQERQTSIRRLLDSLEDLEDALRTSMPLPGEHR
ncbi:phosphotransferase enzyme family protein [Streptomyces lunaelactis]|uniref:phosphotransferase enzyme family protein n=1 Tax=Streptomyces lunaelactis TaxID=1535768 RepID=UPI0015859EC4|nr:phosphotransferase [Streptomyces lunaelactis]NUK18121.1 phosphotransferase [Streptomyces lunaelactis]